MVGACVCIMRIATRQKALGRWPEWLSGLSNSFFDHGAVSGSAAKHWAYTLDEPGAALYGKATKPVKAASYNVGAAGDGDIDGLLSGARWKNHTLTYSFPAKAAFYGYVANASETRIGFHRFDASQIAGTRDALLNYAAVSDLHFVERKETLAHHANLRFAETNAAFTAYSYYPGQTAKAGDAWFNSSRHYYDAPEKGNYAYFTMLHEIGHTLGLKHGNEGNVFGALPAAHNSMEYSVMTYASYIGASTSNGLSNGPASYAQSLMMDDIAALQHLYGANFTQNGGDTVYRWSAATGQMFVNGAAQSVPAGNKIFLTVWDGGGTDTYDFSNYTTNLKIDLNPGKWITTSFAQLADLDGSGRHKAIGNIANALLYHGDERSLIENAVGGSGDDTLTGNQLANMLTGSAGNDVLQGNAGLDTLTGGLGSDTFVFRSWGDGADTITDFASGLDRISLSLKGFSLPLPAGVLDAAHFDGAGAATHANAEFVFDPNAHTLAYDSDGKGVAAAILVARLPTVAALSASDIILL